MTTSTLGSVIYDFFLDYLPQQKGLRSSTIRSYRDTMRLFLTSVAADTKRGVSDLRLEDMALERVLGFLRELEQARHNRVPTRNQRLAALRTFFEYVGRRVPEMLRVCGQVAAIPTKRTASPETRFMAREEIQSLLDQVPDHGRLALRDRALLLFLYNTGARVSEVAELRVEHLVLTPPPQVRLKGKGGKWRSCPLWDQTARALGQLLAQRRVNDPQAPVFTSAAGEAMTRFGIYKRVRLHAASIENADALPRSRRITPHVFRHTTAVHLLEAGVEVNVIRGWLGHVSLDTTNRYAEITVRMKEEAMKICEPPVPAARQPRKPHWRDDAVLLNWLSSL